MKSFFFCFLVFTTSTLFAQDSLITVTDMLRIHTVNSITTSPDGSKTAFVVTSIIPDPANKMDYRYVSHLYMLNANNEPVQLSFGNESSSQPAWSPDGKQLAFVRTADQRPQIFIMNMSGGEAWQLTKLSSGAAGPKWTRDGRIIFTSPLSLKSLLTDSLLNPEFSLPQWPSERPGYIENENLKKSISKADPDGSIQEIRSYLENNVADKKAIVLNKLNFQDESNISAEQNFTQIYVVEVKPDAKPTRESKGFYRFGNPAQGDTGPLVFSANIDPSQHPDRSLESGIYYFNWKKDYDPVVPLLSKKGWSYTNPVLSPDGSRVAFQFSPVSGVDIPKLGIIDLSTDRIDTINFDRNISNVTWSRDKQFLYFLSPSNGGVVLFRVNLSNKEIEQLSSYEKGITSFTLTPGKIIYSQTSVENPSAIFIADENMKNPKQIGEFNGWVKGKKLSFPVKHEFTNNKGMKVEYWVMKPANFSSGKKYPLLLEIHGGPSSMWGPGETSMWHEFQYFCSKGYGVVYSNPRGSGGYGVNFLRANIADWGAGPTSDVLGSLDRTVAEGWADTSKLAITGGSYAGYLTAWIIAHDQRFKAACAQRGVYDLETFFGEGNAWRLVPEYFGGYPWEPKVRQLLQRESPFTYVDKIRTPFIIFHGDNDRRTGFVQSEMMFRSLKVLGRPVEYVRHPNATHEITRSGENRQRIDQLLRTYEFFERWISH